MHRCLLLTSGLLLMGPAVANAKAPKVLWETEVGRTTYRSRIVIDGDRVLVPSNGDSWDGEADLRDGLWVLDARRGRVLHQLVPPGGGERDVNGVSVAAGAWFVATDQGAIVRYAPDGTVVWATSTGGDVEGPPALADVTADGVPEVGAAVEKGAFVVFDGSTGAELYRMRAGEDENPFPQAAAHDLTGDGVADWLVATRDGGMLRALDGRSGAVVWSHQGPGRYGVPPLVADVDGDGSVEVIAVARSQITISEPSSGAVRLLYTTPGRDEQIHGVGVHPDAHCVVFSVSASRPRLVCLAIDGVERWSVPLLGARVSAAPVVGDIDGKAGAEVVVGTEGGLLVAVDAEGRVLWEWQAGGAIESPVTLADLDGNGRVEILVASHDGFVRALRTQGRVRAR